MRISTIAPAILAALVAMGKDGENMAKAEQVRKQFEDERVRIAAGHAYAARRAGQKCPVKYARELNRCRAQVYSPAWRAWAKLRPLERA